MTGGPDHESLLQGVQDSVIASAASKATFTGAGASVLGWLVSSQAAVLFGILLGLAGLAVNVVFSLRRDRREAREHAARMSILGEGESP